MRLRVIHETVYQYSPAVQNAQHMAHLRPRTGALQRVLTHALQVDPVPLQCETAEDVFGNRRAYFNLPFGHERLSVRAESLVETSAAPAAPPGEPWERVREQLCYRRGLPYQPAAEFSFVSPYIPRHAEFVAYAAESFAPGRPMMEAARDLMSRIHQDFAYTAHATDAGTPALESLRLRRGVCQDFAHVMIGCLRSLGLAARYVSGYLLTEPPPGQRRLVGADASHAWVSVWSPATAQGTHDGAAADLPWFDLDPTNDRAAGEDYVTLAIGRDYSDVSPLRGVIHGGDHHVLQVAVTVEPAHATESVSAPVAVPVPVPVPVPVQPVSTDGDVALAAPAAATAGPQDTDAASTAPLTPSKAPENPG